MKHKELNFYILIIAVCNLGIFTSTVPGWMLFDIEKIFSGQIWRIFTHPFVHVSWYHLLLDGAAFVMLYSQLTAKTLAERTAYLAASAIGTILAVAAAMLHLESVGYCGLSGIDHGLMTVCALEMLTARSSDKTTKIAGAISLLLVLAKSIYEAAAGHMFLEFLHFNMMGSPVAVSHLGGAAGGLIAFSVTYAIRINMQKMHIKSALNAV